jgi:transcriptional regulator with XRE-family HTH domain
MRITDQLTDDAVLAEIGKRLARTRLERNLTQRQLGDEAGVGRPAIQRIEAGAPVRLPAFLRVLRVLGLLDALDRLVPEPAPSPIERLKLAGRERQRARGSRSSERQAKAEPWTWGNEPEGEP